MSKMIKAARYYGRNDIRIEMIEQQPLLPGTVRIDVAWCGICGTDLHEYLDGPIFVPCACHHPISGEKAPITMGHEFSGVISELGEGVTDLKVGQKVVVEPLIVNDNVDTGPTSKDYHLSENMTFIGLGGKGGGLSENIVVDRRWIHPVDKLNLDEAALIEPLSVAYHAVERSGAKEGQWALITGAGPIGLLTASVLKAKGVKVIISEISSLRRQKAIDTGVVDYTFNPLESDVVEEVRKITGRGADLGFECTSVEVAFNTLVDAVRPQAVIVNIAIWGKPCSVDMNKLTLKELDVRGTIVYVNNHPDVIKLLESGKINLKPFITAKISLDNLIDEGFETLIHRNETAVKILVSPTGKGLE